MKIENRGIEITDIPGFASLTIAPDAELSDGVSIKLTGHPFTTSSPETWRFTIAELTEVCAAFGEALIAALRTSATAEVQPAEPTGPRTWNKGAPPEPEGVTKVRDCDGDVWTRGANGWGIETNKGAAPWSALSDYVAPLTEVTE